MCLYQRLLLSAGLFLLTLAAAAPVTRADALRLSAASQLDPSAATAIYSGDDETLQASPYAVSAPGNLLTFDLGVPGASFYRFDSDGMNTAFADGTRLLDTNGSYGPVTIRFGQGVGEIGLLVQSSGVDVASFTLTAYNNTRQLLRFTTDPIDNTGALGATAFLGVRAEGGDVITRFTIASASNDPTFTNFFIMGPVSYQNSDVAPVPEPATCLLLGAGLAGIAGSSARWRRRSR